MRNFTCTSINRDSINTGLVGKLANAGKKVLSAGLVGGALILPYAMSNEANADLIQVINQSDPSYTDVAYFSGVVDANHPGTSKEYDPSPNIPHDIDLDTSGSPHNNIFVIYQELIDEQSGEHLVNYNFAPKPELTDSYTMKLSFENRTGTNFYNIPDSLVLTDFTIDNPNGVTDYGYTLSVDTDGNGDYDYFQNGLVSDVFTSQDKKFGEWEQDLPTWIDWTKGTSYGEITFTPIPEPSTLLLLAGAGLAGAGYLATRRLTRSHRRRRGEGDDLVLLVMMSEDQQPRSHFCPNGLDTPDKDVLLQRFIAR